MIDFIINNFDLLAAAKCTLFSPEEYKIIHKFYVIILIATPIAVLALCTVDMAQAVIAQDDSGIKKAQGRAIKRIIAGVALFFIPVLLNVVLGALSGDINFGGTCVSEITK